MSNLTTRGTQDVELLSPWYHTHGEEFPGQQFIFGCKVVYRPADTQKVAKQQPKMGPTTMVGISDGYVLNPGYTWSKSY